MGIPADRRSSRATAAAFLALTVGLLASAPTEARAGCKLHGIASRVRRQNEWKLWELPPTFGLATERSESLPSDKSPSPCAMGACSRPTSAPISSSNPPAPKLELWGRLHAFEPADSPTSTDWLASRHPNAQPSPLHAAIERPPRV